MANKESSMINSSDNVLYHYCSMEAFLGIVQSQFLRLTNIRFMNDSKEVSWIYELAKKVLWDKQFRCHSENEKRLCKRLMSHCDELFLNESYFPGYYGSCFSKNGDSLSQWRAYADDGKGVAIGFSRQFLESCVAPHRIKLQEVEYIDGTDLSGVTTDVETAFSKFNGITRSMTDDEINRVAYETFTPWDLKAIFVKNAAFNEEDEVRIFHLPHSQKSYAQIGDMGFFHRRAVIVPFLPLKIALGSAPITCIVLGPRNRADHNSYSIRMLAREHGFSLALSQFKYSSASYGETRRSEKLYPPPY